MAKRKSSTIRYLRLSCVLLILTLCCYFDRHGSTKTRAKVQQLKWPQQHALSSSATTTTTTTTTTLSSLSFHHLPHDMGFIHIGKTGGATVARNIRRACTSRRACQANIQALVAPTNLTESQISRHVSAYYHMRKVSSSRYHSSYLVTVRDPLDRVASWYIFRHPANAHFLNVSPTQNVDLRTLFACYPTLDSLVTRGLSIHPYPKQQRQQQRQETNNDGDCSQLAQSIVGGTMQPPRRGDHMGWNYEFYLRDILLLTQQKQQKPLIFVIRTEFLWQDWSTIEQLLGGSVAVAAAAAGNHNDDNSATNDTMAPTKNVSHKRHDSSTPLPVSNTTMSKQGVNNLCRILGREIDVYAHILQRAVNLEPGQVQESLQRVHDKCGGTRQQFWK